MIVRNFGTYGDTEYEGLKTDSKYWFPHAFKYISWFLVVSSIIVTSIVLIFYGMSFGMVKTYLWATAFAVSFLIGLIITAPIRILVLSFFNSLFLKKAPVVVTRPIPLSLLSNPLNKVKKNEVLKYRKYNAGLYTPIPLHKLQTRFEDIKYNIELRNLTVDVIAYLAFMISVFYTVLINKTPMGYYSNHMASELILSGKYTNSISFGEVDSYDKFIEYLNETFLPALLPESPNKEADKILKNTSKRKKRFLYSTNHKTPPDNIKKRQILDNLNKTDLKKSVFEKGWTMNNNIKLLGKPRLRQVRVKGTCKQLRKLRPRNDECAPELNMFNVETRSFTLRWEDRPPMGLTKAQALPWTYQSAWETGNVPVLGKLLSYPGGGYVLTLARHISDARIILDFLDTFQWVDMKTRAIFIDLTLYNVNTNLFNVVTLILEAPAIGYLIPSYQIHTCKFIFAEHELEYVSIIMTGIFSLLLFFFLLRESVRIHRTSFLTYMGWSFAVLDLAVVLFGVISVLFLICRNYYVSNLLKRLEMADNNEFVSFAFASFWHSWSLYIEAVLICLASFKFLRLLTYRVSFYQLQATLTHCYKHFFHLSCLQIILLAAFANFFHLTLINFSERFSNIGNTLSTLFGRGVAYDDTFDLNLLSEGFIFLTPFFFWLFTILIALLVVNVFIAIICLYFHIVRHVPLKNKYNILDYVKYFLTKKHRRDILRLEYRTKTGEGDVMRLTGGGNKHSKEPKKKKIKVKKVKKKEKSEELEEVEMRKIMMKDFITENLYDTTEYMDLQAGRALAMRNLTASFLTTEEKEKTEFRENALRIIFYLFISRQGGLTKEDFVETKGPYFTVVKKHDTEILDKRVFREMRKVVEDLGKKKDWFIEEPLDEEITSFENKLIVLEKKLCCLQRKIKQK